MKTSSSPRRRGFTLVEMLAVVTIIIILSAIVLGGLKMAKDRTNLNKAKVQVADLTRAIEEYKVDTGTYPASTNATGLGQTALLRQALYLDGANDATHAKKIYLGTLDETSKVGWINGTGAAATIIDPWGNEYRYRSGASASTPDFDLWSVGKDGVTAEDDPKDKKSQDDIHN